MRSGMEMRSLLCITAIEFGAVWRRVLSLFEEVGSNLTLSQWASDDTVLGPESRGDWIGGPLKPLDVQIICAWVLFHPKAFDFCIIYCIVRF